MIPEGIRGEYSMNAAKNPVGAGLGKAGRTVCENFRAIVADVTDSRQWYVARIRCKMWSCEHCAQINKSKWRAHIIDGINKIGTFERWWFVTVTAHRRSHKAQSAAATVRNLQRGLKVLYDRIRRIVVKGTDKLEYCRVFEHHKTKRAHAHLIMRGTFTHQTGDLDKKGNDKGMTRWLKDNCASVGLGYQASAKPIRSTTNVHAGFVAAYVTKYLTKDGQGFGTFPLHLRRIQCTGGFGALDERESQFTWTMKSGIYEDEVIGRKVTDLNLMKDVTTDDFETKHIYPPELDIY